MGRYINWDDVTLRHPSINNVGGASEIGSAYIGYIEFEIDGMLASHFTVPFSNNNVTIKDLCIDRVYAKAGNLKVEEAKMLNADIMATIERLKTGSQVMMNTAGEALFSSVGDTIFSTTEDYNPVFGMGPTEFFEVDSEQVYDEEQARGY